VNYDGKFHGPVTVRTALANSYNIPAVKTLQFVGIYDDPNVPGEDGLIAFAQRMGITTLTRTDYGLSLTLGGGEVTLLEMTSAFSVFANSGARVEPMAITRITDYSGNVIFQAEQPQAKQVLKPEYAYLISSILLDNAARLRCLARIQCSICRFLSQPKPARRMIIEITGHWVTPPTWQWAHGSAMRIIQRWNTYLGLQALLPSGQSL